MVDRAQTESSQQAVPVNGISGSPESQFFLKSLECAVGDMVLIHKFLYFPECPIPFLGRDLMSRLLAQIIFSPEEQQLHLQAPPDHAWQCLMKPWEEEKIENSVHLIVWAAGKLGRAKGTSSVKVDFKL